MSAIRLSEKIDVEFMEPRIDGNSLYYVPITHTVHLWKCDGCGLVWPTKNQANDCTKRGHKERYQQGYGGYVDDRGYHPKDVYTREAIRRDNL